MMKDASNYLPLTPQQAISQIITAIAFGIFAISYTSFEGKSKFFCDSLTLDIVTKAREFNLVRPKSLKAKSIKARAASGT